jgi:hypothetical protein
VVLVLHGLLVVVDPIAAFVSQLLLRHMTSLSQTERDGSEYSRLEVVYALLVFAHFAGSGEELGGEEWSVEVCGRCGVDGSCLQARGCKYRSSEADRRRRKHDICMGRSETKENADFKDLADGMNSAAITICESCPLSYRQRRQSMRGAATASRTMEIRTEQGRNTYKAFVD